MVTTKNTSNTTRHYLNALKQEEGRLPPPKQGIWSSYPSFLADYANSVDVRGQLSPDRASHSVPSVFQRPILFYQALADPQNPLHFAMRGQWRGLMAVLCLSDWLQLDVKTASFSVPRPDPKASSSVGVTPPGDLHFEAMLRNQLPQREIKGSDGNITWVSDWDGKWNLIRCGGALLGATSPWTLVYTSSQPKAPACIPWRRNGLLIDPIECYDPKRNSKPLELSLLYTWVAGILSSRKDWGIPDHLGDQNNLIYRTLTAWQEDLKAYVDKDLTPAMLPGIFSEPPYSNILRKPSSPGGDLSDLLLRSKKAGRPVLVLSEELPAERRILRGILRGRVNVSALDEPEGDGFGTTDEVRVEHAYIVPEKLFFPPNLVRIPSMKAAAKTGVADISMPLTPDFFRYFDHADVKQVTLSRSGTGYEAKIEIPLQGGATVTVTRPYREEDVQTLPLNALAFAVWPDRDDKDWTENFAAYAAPTDGAKLAVRPLQADGSVADPAAQDDSHQAMVRIWSCKSLPVGFALGWKADADAEPVPAGLLLRDKLVIQKPLIAGLKCEVGVDFGTSSTMVMVDRGQGPEDMVFGGHMLVLAGEQDVVDEIEQNLYPTSTVTTPFRTLLYQSAATIFDPTAPPFTLRFASSAEDILRSVVNVKWGHHPGTEAGSPLLIYLKALIRYIVWELRCEGMSTLKFHWSYPLSLPIGPLNIMTNFWKGGVRQSYSKKNGLVIDVADGISESEAACHAFTGADARTASSGLTVTVDIGGGSTDIAFWSVNTLVDQASFKLAGNDIFDKNYLSGEVIRQFLAICHNAQPDADVSRILSRPDTYGAYINGALTEAKINGVKFTNEDPNLHPIPMHIVGGNQKQIPWFHFRSMIYLFFTGLSYYLGVHSRGVRVESGRVDIYFGGRASALLTWMAYRGSDFIPAMEHAFREGLSRHADENTEVAFPAQSAVPQFHGLSLDFHPGFPALKSEVAKGLLVKSKVQAESFEKKKGAVAGEVGWTLRGEKVAWQTWLIPADYGAVHPPEDFESTTIGHYRAEMLGEGGKGFCDALLIDKEGLCGLYVDRSVVEQLVSNSTGTDDHISQPLFAYELQALMKQYAENLRTHPAGASGKK